jgi:hypothetical protein
MQRIKCNKNRLIAIVWGASGYNKTVMVIETDIPDERINIILKGCLYNTPYIETSWQWRFRNCGSWNFVDANTSYRCKDWLNANYPGITIFRKVEKVS